jgi:hypothetical protein
VAEAEIINVVIPSAFKSVLPLKEGDYAELIMGEYKLSFRVRVIGTI